MPVGFWDDPDGKKYRAAYFDVYPGVWHHGVYIRVTKRGGVIVYGRSDATLNPGGVRIGTAEIYGPVEALDFVTDSIVVGQQHESDTRLLLFVVLKNGCQLTAALTDKVKTAIRNQTSPRHVPALVLQVSDIPRTINGKKVELAVSRTVNGHEVSNRHVLANPQVLEQFTRHVGLQADAAPKVESRTINPTARE
jgi:acetoacetyl-CoA synthetase